MLQIRKIWKSQAIHNFFCCMWMPTKPAVDEIILQLCIEWNFIRHPWILFIVFFLIYILYIQDSAVKKLNTNRQITQTELSSLKSIVQYWLPNQQWIQSAVETALSGGVCNVHLATFQRSWREQTGCGGGYWSCSPFPSVHGFRARGQAASMWRNSGQERFCAHSRPLQWVSFLFLPCLLKSTPAKASVQP